MHAIFVKFPSSSLLMLLLGVTEVWHRGGGMLEGTRCQCYLPFLLYPLTIHLKEAGSNSPKNMQQSLRLSVPTSPIISICLSRYPERLWTTALKAEMCGTGICGALRYGRGEKE